MQLSAVVLSAYMLSPSNQPLDVMIQNSDVIALGVIFECAGEQCINLGEAIRGEGHRNVKMCQESKFDQSYQNKKYLLLLEEGLFCYTVVGNERGIIEEVDDFYKFSGRTVSKSELMKVIESH